MCTSSFESFIAGDGFILMWLVWLGTSEHMIHALQEVIADADHALRGPLSLDEVIYKYFSFSKGLVEQIIAHRYW